MTDVSQQAIPPRVGEWQYGNHTATISRTPREGIGDDMIVVEYRGARVHITRRPAMTWSLRFMQLGRPFTASLPKRDSEAACIFLAVRRIDQTIRIREDARR